MVQFQTHVSQKGASDSKNNFVTDFKHDHKQKFYSKLLKKQA